MTRIFLALLLAFSSAAPVLAEPSAEHAATMRDLAPADQYFGQLKMSVLGIRNELNTLERRAASGDPNVAAITGKLAFVDPLAHDFALIAAPQTMPLPVLALVLMLAAVGVSALGSGISLRRFLRV